MVKTRSSSIGLKAETGRCTTIKIWSFEHINIARPSLLGCGITFPRTCRWENGRPHQRQWFRTRFKELDKDKVVCKLQLTHDESKIDIVKELLEAQVDGEVLPAKGSNVAIDKVDDFRARLKIMDEQSPESKLTVVRQVHRAVGECSNRLREQIELPSTSIILTDYVDLTTPHQVSEGKRGQIEPPLSSSVVLNDMDLATPHQVSGGQRGEIEPLLSSLVLTNCMDLTTPYQVSEGQTGKIDPLPSTAQNGSPSVVVISDDDNEEENIGRKEQTSLEENTQMKEIDSLKEVNKILKDRLEEQNAELRNLRDGYKILKDQLQERNAELDERNAELDNLRQENHVISSSSDDLVARIERIVQKWIS